MRKEIGQSFTLPNPFSCLGYLPQCGNVVGPIPQGMPAAQSQGECRRPNPASPSPPSIIATC